MTIPSDYAGLTGWWDASQEAFVNNDPVGTFTDRSGNARHFTATGAARPLFKTGISPLGGSALLFDGTDDEMSTGLVTPADFFNATTASMICVFQAVAIDTDDPPTTPYINDVVWSDDSGQMGLHLRQTGPAAHAYHNDIDALVHTISTGTTRVVSMRRSTAPTWFSALDAGSEISSTPTSSLDVATNFNMRLGHHFSGFGNVYIMELAFWDTTLTASDMTTLAESLRAKWVVAGGQPASRRKGGVEHATPGPNYPSRRW